MLNLIPTIALGVLNLIVLVYVVRERGQTRSGQFLAVNAVALLVWMSGVALYGIVGPWAGYLPTLAQMVIAANLLHFAGSQPTPLNRFFGRPWAWAVVFVPAVVPLFLTEYRAAPGTNSRQFYYYSHVEDALAAEGGWALLVAAVYLLLAIILLSTRYNVLRSGPDRNLPGHLVAITAAPVIFAFLFAMTSASATAVAIIPSPSLLVAMIAQLGILVVIRQEEVERPLYLSRWIYFSIILLVGFLLSHLIYTVYESLTNQTLLSNTVKWTILSTVILTLMVGSLPAAQQLFDRMMFRRAWEYRQLVREAQQELLETRRRLQRAERLSVIGEMAAQIAHEIKNPLGPIKGYTEMMRARINKTPDFPHRETFLRQLSIIHEEVDAIDGKVRQLLDLSRKPEITFQLEDINKIVERAATLLRLESDTLSFDNPKAPQNVRVLVDTDPTLPTVTCSRMYIEEALNNLCRNAFDAVEGRGTVVLGTRRRRSGTGADGLAIIVSDDGPGLSKTARENLFEPFYTEKVDGTGLGLSIVKSHVELHNGELLFSEREGGGTEVVLWLPIEFTVETADEEIRRLVGGGRRVGGGTAEPVPTPAVDDTVRADPRAASPR